MTYVEGLRAQIGLKERQLEAETDESKRSVIREEIELLREDLHHATWPRPEVQ